MRYDYNAYTVVYDCIIGEKGVAYTLVTSKDKDFAGHLVRNLEGANQDVPQELMDLAMQVKTASLCWCNVQILCSSIRNFHKSR